MRKPTAWKTKQLILSKKFDTIYLVVEPKCLSLPIRIKILNSFFIDTGNITKNHGGKPTFIRDISKSWNYEEISNILEKLLLTYMGILVWSEDQDNHCKLLLFHDLFVWSDGKIVGFYLRDGFSVNNMLIIPTNVLS